MAGHIPYDIIPSNNTKANEARIQNVISDDFMNQVQNGIPIPANDPNSQIIAKLARIVEDLDIRRRLETIGLNFNAFNFSLTAGVAQQIIAPSKFPRGYYIINPAEVNGFTSTITPFASAARAPGTFDSAGFNVSGVDTARFFLNVTANALPHTLVVNLQTQDPLSGNWATAQTDIFGASAAVGTYYANAGPLGIDNTMRLEAVVGAGAGTMTFSISSQLKGTILTPSGSTIYLGPQNVTTAIGFPLIPGGIVQWNLEDDVPLFAVSPAQPLVIRVLQLQ